MRWVVILFLVALLGCAPVERTEEPPSTALRVGTKIALPLSIAAAYFGSIASHEGGHALAAKAAGATRIDVSVLPTPDGEGGTYLGVTNFYVRRSTTPLEDRFFNVSGPMAQQTGYILAREVLKTGYVPDALQPTVQAYAVACEIGVYAECFLGFARKRTADFGKEPEWVGLAFFGTVLAYDLFDLLTDDPLRYFKVLVGEEFYQPGARRGLLLTAAPQRGGGYLALCGEF